MLAAYYDRPGPAEHVLHVGSVPDPTPGPGQVLVEVAYSAINPSDIRHRSGQGAGRAATPTLRIPHQDGSGWIAAVGEGVPPSRIGSPVWIYHGALGHHLGTAAQKIVVPQERAVDLPQDVPLSAAAGLGVPFLTAFGALSTADDLQGKHVLVTAGAGAVGSAAIQLAHHLGARVTATVSSDAKADTARRAGADAVVDRTRNDPASAIAAVSGEGIDHVIDVALHSNLPTYVGQLRPDASVVAYATEPADAPRLPVLELMRRNISLRFLYVYTLPSATLSAGIATVNNLLRSGVRPALAQEHLPLEHIVEAHHRVEAGAHCKVVLTVAADGAPPA